MSSSGPAPTPGPIAGSSGTGLIAVVRGCRPHLIAAAVFSGLINVLNLAPSIFMLQVYDRVVPTRGVPTLLLLTLILVVALGVYAILDAVRMRLLLRASIRLERRLAPPSCCVSWVRPAARRSSALRRCAISIPSARP